MERVLTGLDIMPAATRLTCSMLSSAHPSVAYGESRVHTMLYGIDGGETHIGALDLLDSEHSYSLFAAGESMGGTESDSGTEHSVTIRDKSCDLVIMNPPFTRPTNHEAGHGEIPVPSFAGFSTSHEEQMATGRKLKKANRLFGSGNAGLASNFMDLGHSKLRDGGVLALVVPFAHSSGAGPGRERGRRCGPTTAKSTSRRSPPPARRRGRSRRTRAWPSVSSSRRSAEERPARRT